VVAAHFKTDDLLNCWTTVRIFPATTRNFTKDTALSEHGMGAVWARHAMCESARGRQPFGHSHAKVKSRSNCCHRVWTLAVTVRCGTLA